jgi:DNA-binding transcriptional MerR regulator
MEPPMTGLKVGALAKRAGVTVRTLHHYDRIGLVVPTARSGAGHRLYGERDVRRLTQVVLLRGLGMSLDEIGRALGAGGRGHTIRELLRRRAALLRERVRAESELCERMEGLLRMMQTQRGSVAASDFLDLLEMITMTESYYTPEQLAQLKNRREVVGEEAIKSAERQWPELIRNMIAEMSAGTDPADPRVQLLARQWKQLVESFTGGDPGIAQSLGKIWKEKGSELMGKMKMGFDPKLFEYVGKAQKALTS